MPVQKLKKFLDENKVKYVSIAHSLAYTAQEIAALTHIKGQYLAKTVMVELDDEMAMVVVPANFHVNLELLMQATGARKVELASEEAFKDLFPQCEVGAMPPFGHLYGMETYVAPELAEDDEIAFNAGTHTELLKLSYNDFERLVGPKVIEVCRMPKAA